MPDLNIGVLAHVDAGKTSLTEQLLFHAGVIRRVGRVDAGDTQTDSSDIERRRGITIQSAVVSFRVGDVHVNLIDTPGHPDFIAEVERALRVLDGVVLVVSAVEGVQAQTRTLMRALARLRVPVVIFANKVDRSGARAEHLVAELAERLGVACVAMSDVTGLGSAAAAVRPRPIEATADLAELLAARSDAFLASYLDGAPLSAEDYRAELVRQTRRAVVSPVLFGSAMTGEGIADLIVAIPEFLAPVSTSGLGRALRATVFKIERGRSGEKIACVRLFSGELGSRDQVVFHRATPEGQLRFGGKATSVQVFDGGPHTVPARARAGQIAKVWGLKEVRVGDQLGEPEPRSAPAYFPPPSLETVVRAVRPKQAAALFAAVQELAEEDPLITVRRDDDTGQVTVRLYGEVQKEVITVTLAAAHGIAVEYAGTQTICVERPVGTGSAVLEIGNGRNPYVATLGMRVALGPVGSGLRYKLEVELGALPPSFHTAIEESARVALQRGLYGWDVVDCVVTVTRTGYFSPVTAAGDFRGVTPLVLMSALRQAGTEVLEPISRFELELPADAVGPTLSRLVEARAVVSESVIQGRRAVLRGTLPTGETHRFEQRLPALSHGEGLLSTEVCGHRPVPGPPPSRVSVAAAPA